MGTYIYALKNSIKKNAKLNGRQIQVGVAKFQTKQNWDGEYDRVTNAVLTKAYAVPSDVQAEFIVFSHDTKNLSGDMVFKNNFKGVWSDGSGWYSGLSNKEDCVGTLIKVGKFYHVVPTGTSVKDFMKSNFPKLYSKSLPHTQVYVKMNKGYTATVRNIEDLIDYMNGFGFEQVDVNHIHISNRGESPTWFQMCVQEEISKRKELSKEPCA